jgi:hypothetical protein
MIANYELLFSITRQIVSRGNFRNRSVPFSNPATRLGNWPVPTRPVLAGTGHSQTQNRPPPFRILFQKGRLIIETGRLPSGGRWYALPRSGECNAGFNWPTYSGGQRYDQALVGYALEGTSYVPGVQNLRMDAGIARCQHSAKRRGRGHARGGKLSSHYCWLPKLRTRNVFQCCADWCYARIYAACAKWVRKCSWTFCVWQPSTRQRASTAITVRRSVQKEIAKWHRAAADQLQVMCRPAQQCSPGIWGAR